MQRKARRSFFRFWKRLAETGFDISEKNIAILGALIDGYEPTDREYVMSVIPKTYRLKASQDCPEAGLIRADIWEREEYLKKGNCEYDMPEHYTVKGEKVRSKSEVTIANMLYEKGIPYRYEEQLQLRSGKLASPDFTVYVKSEGRTKLLEHCGTFSSHMKT